MPISSFFTTFPPKYLLVLYQAPILRRYELNHIVLLSKYHLYSTKTWSHPHQSNISFPCFTLYPLCCSLPPDRRQYVLGTRNHRNRGISGLRLETRWWHQRKTYSTARDFSSPYTQHDLHQTRPASCRQHSNPLRNHGL